MANVKTWFDLGWRAACALALGWATLSSWAGGYLPDGRSLSGAYLPERRGQAPAPARSPGYLALLGPAPLRFQEPPPPRPVVGLPPPPLTNAPTATAAAPQADPDSVPFDFSFLPNMTNETAAVEAVTSAASPAAEAPTNTVSESFQPLPTPQRSGPSITPQMLLEFFKPVQHSGTNAPAAVLMPIQFNPPVPLTPPSSRATYKVE